MKHHIFITALICMVALCSCLPDNSEVHILRKRSLCSPDNATDMLYLPQDVTPMGYHVWLQPFAQEGYYQGRVQINISCLASTNTIILHAGENLNIGKAEISFIEPRDNDDEHSRQIGTVSIQRVQRRESPEDWLEVTVSDNLQQDVLYQLTLEFSSDLGNENSETVIFYGNYSDDMQKQRWFVGASMQQNKPRKAFPCFDEFQYKAPFAISIGRPEKMRSLSNMVLRNSEKIMDQPGWMWDHFETSPPMSPFSVNFFIYDPEVIVSLEPRDDLGSATLHMYGPTHLKNDLQEAGNKILQTVEKIETYLRMKYPLPDLQIVVSPGLKFHHYGFGLTIFSGNKREDFCWPLTFLLDMADQWLVHLTTPHSWSEMTFANGLTEYVSHIGFIDTITNKKAIDFFDWAAVYSMATNSFRRKSYDTPYINVIGTWVLRMLNYTLGENTLRSGLNSFLSDRSYKTFVSENVLAALDVQARRDFALPPGVTVTHVVKSWQHEKLFPLLTVFRNYKTGTAHVEQQTFILDKSDRLYEREQDHQWYVPLVVLRSNQPKEKLWNVAVWMKEERAVTLKNMPSPDAFVLINPEIIGLFIVNYDPTNWALIIQHLHTNRTSQLLSATTRAKLMTDAALLADAGELAFSVPFDLSLILAEETDFAPWYAINKFLVKLHDKLQHTKATNLFQEYLWKLVSPIYEQYGGFSGREDFDTKTVQEIVESIMCYLGAEDCIEAFSGRYQLGNDTLLSCPVLQRGKRDIWENTLLWALGHNDKRHLDKGLLTTLASCTQHKDRMNQLLEAVLLKYAVSDEDMLDTIESVQNHYLLFDYVSEKWLSIKKKYESKPEVLKSLVFKTTSKFVTADGYDLVRSFYMARQRDTPSVLPVVGDALKKIVENSKWYDRSLPEIESWLRQFLREN